VTKSWVQSTTVTGMNIMEYISCNMGIIVTVFETSTHYLSKLLAFVYYKTHSTIIIVVGG